MGSHVDCISCIISKANKMANTYIAEKQQKLWFMREVMREILNTEHDRAAPLVEAKMTRLARSITGIQDFFADEKKYFNDLMLSLEQDIELLISASQDPFQEAIKAAMSGNIIDLSALDDVSPELVKSIVFKTIKEQNLDEGVYKRLVSELEAANNLLYLGDNAGEIVMDKLLLKYIKERFPHIRITLATRSAPISSDITEADAYYVGIDQFANIINNGTDLAGTDLLEVSETFREQFHKADVIISKGQGNYETLAGTGHNIFYLFLCKCDVFVSKLQVRQFDPVFQTER